MNRRGFLKAVVSFASLAAASPVVALLLEDAAVPDGSRWFASILENSRYDIYRDVVMVRHDGQIGGHKFCCAQDVPVMEWMEQPDIAREKARLSLLEYMDRHKLDVAKLEPLKPWTPD